MSPSRPSSHPLPQETAIDAPAPAVVETPAPAIPTHGTLPLVCLGLLVLFTISLFAYTVKIRKPWFGVLSVTGNNYGVTLGHHQWLTGSTLKFVKNWYREGAMHLRFAMLESPRSVEYPTLASRSIYASYPPGTLLPIYAIGKAIGMEPTAGMVMGYNLFNHLLIALLLGLTVFFFAQQLRAGPVSALLFAAIPVLLELLLPAPLYWHQNVFFSDQAVILPLVLVIFLEVLRGSVVTPKARLIITILQGCCLFYGTFTDWYALFIALALFGKRLLTGEITLKKGIIKETAIFWAPVLLALLLFAWQLQYLHAFGILFGKFALRTGGGYDGKPISPWDFIDHFWLHYIKYGYGTPALVLLWAALLLFLGVAGCYLVRHIRRQPLDSEIVRAMTLVGVLLVPPFMQILIFNNHSFVHDFSTLKFTLPLTTVPYVMLPLLLARLFAPRWLAPADAGTLVQRSLRRVPLYAANVILLALACWHIKSIHYFYPRFFPDPSPELIAQGEFIQEHFGYTDVLVSYTRQIPKLPPQWLAYTMKEMYRVHSPAEIEAIERGLQGREHRIIIWERDVLHLPTPSQPASPPAP